ncbi:MAG: flavodoxin [Phototrophicales bacterium]|nr:MAG: flavodoxin [Phototrophicales bacterium]
MAKIGLFYGSSTGKTEAVAYQIKEEFDKQAGAGTVEVHNIGSATPEQVLSYEYLIMGIPTWNTGELQDDWAVFFPKIANMNFNGKKVAIFGLGDQNGYGFNFLDAVGMLGDELMLHGADVYGVWSTEKYQFNESKARIEGENYFIGLGIDEDGQSDLTAGRIQQWVKDVKAEFNL